MVSKVHEIEQEEDFFPGLDEGWWTSILTDEIDQRIPIREASRKGSINVVSTPVDWERAKAIQTNDQKVRLYVHGFNRGGLLVAGQEIEGFVPISHLLDAPGETLDRDERLKFLNEYLGRTLTLKIIELKPDSEQIIFSERAATVSVGKRTLLMKSIQEGDIVLGTVTNITDFGAFVDLGGVEGLIHVSELSWGRVQHPGDILEVGETVKTMVLQVSAENSKVALSVKRLSPNPWESLSKRYQPGDVVLATITDILRFGAFARLEEGVEGLIHVSSIEFNGGKREVERVLSVGQKVRVKILHIEAERRRLGLGLERNS